MYNVRLKKRRVSQMSVKVEDFTPGIKSNTKVKASTFLRMICDTVIQKAEPKTPKDKGNLSRDILKQVLGLHAVIDWRKVYAQYQERGKREDGTHVIKNYTTPGTGPHFAENAINEAIKDTPIIAKRVF